MDWLEIAVRTPSEGIEPVAEIFRELGAGGVVIEDPAVIFEYASRTNPEEWAVPPCSTGNGMPLVKAYLALEEGPGNYIETLKGALGSLGVTPAPEIITRLVAEEDWANAWRVYYKPVRIGRRLVIKPTWEECRADEDDIVIDMDPGMAFGCGSHATTSLCLRLLEKYITPGSTVYDVGAGSGILAVASAKLGASKVVAVDIDPVACRVAVENVSRNGVDGRVHVVHGDKLHNITGNADLIVSNIIADAIIELTPQAAGLLFPGRIFIASGIIAQRLAEVAAAMEAVGLSVCEQLEEGQWLALAAQKKT